jgi:hypothetical protein
VIDGVLGDDSRKILAWALGAAVRLENRYGPRELARAVARFAAHCDDERPHEAIGNVTLDDMYRRRHREIVSRREKVECLTLGRGKKENLRDAAEPQTGAGISSKPICREV